MHYLESIVLNFIKKEYPEYLTKTFILGFSGGVDSLILSYILSKYNIPFVAVHVEHGLSDNALSWVEFCQKFSETHNFKLFIENVKVEKNARESLEENARILRYKAYKKYYDIYQSPVLLGHHSDDLVESMLLNLLNRSGVNGLGTMPSNYFNEEFGIKVLRPYLSDESIYQKVINKELLLDYANANNLEFIYDESNDDNNFSRNFLRNDIIPNLKKHFGNINKPMMKTNIEARELKKDYTIEPVFEDFYELENTDKKEIFNFLEFVFKKHLSKKYNSNTFNQLSLELERDIKSNDNKYINYIENYVIFVYQDKVYFMHKNYLIFPDDHQSYDYFKSKNLNKIYKKNDTLRKNMPYVFRNANIYKFSGKDLIYILNFSIENNIRVKKEKNKNFFNKVVHYFNL